MSSFYGRGGSGGGGDKPIAISELINDVGYVTSKEVETLIDSKLSVNKELPAVGKENTIYVLDNEIYFWDNTEQKYVPLQESANPTWDSF